MVDALIIISTGRTKINRRNLDTDQDKTLDEGDAMHRRPGWAEVELTKIWSHPRKEVIASNTLEMG